MPADKKPFITPVNNTDICILSILCPTIPSRQLQFESLMINVINQIKYCNDTHPVLGLVEFVWDNSRSFINGGLSIGRKRQELLITASGKYLCFLDDDEDVAPNYIETLLRLCYKDKDVCAFRNISTFDNYWCVVDMDINHENEQANPTDIVKRKPWHICPVRSEFAKLYSFENSNYGEDWVWFEKVLSHCKTQAKTNMVLHRYNHSTKTSEADKIMNA